MDVLAAIILLNTFPGTYTHPPSDAEFPSLRDSVHRVALAWEILDPRETGYIFAKHSEFEADLNLLRQRHQDLRDAPRLCECHRLPTRFVANEFLQFNRAYRKHLVDRRELERDRAQVIDAAVAEVDECYRVWDAIRDARAEFYYVTVRRQALMRLRCMVGDEAYYLGEWPSPVPTWRFAER